MEVGVAQTVVLSVIGVIGVAGLFQKTKSRVLPAIGTTLNLPWVCWLAAARGGII